MKVHELIAMLSELPQYEEISVHVSDQGWLGLGVGMPFYFKNKPGFNKMPDGWYLPAAWPIEDNLRPRDLETDEFIITTCNYKALILQSQ